MTDDRTRSDSRLLHDPSNPEQVPALVIVHHPDARFIGFRRVIGEREVLLLGRDVPDLVPGALKDGRISRQHAEVKRKDGGLTIKDLGSHNGTTVNGERVESRDLLSGDLVGIGDVLLIYRDILSKPWTARDGMMIGVSDALTEVYERIELIAKRETTVLILGEPGVGKELVAQEVHARSDREGRFVAVNCGGIADNLVLSELFGHARGSFSGADRARKGLVEAARGGTLFLDEIGDAPPALQVAMLRLLQEGTFRAVGDDQTRTADVRILAATNRDLDAFVAEDRFRADLLSRLRQWEIAVPPLRERIEDVPPLAQRFADEAAGSPVKLDRDLVCALCWQPWPGNVRELAATMERLVIEARGADRIERPSWLDAQVPDLVVPPVWGGGGKVRPDPDRLRARLVHHRANIKELAQELGIGRNTLYRWLKEADIDVEAVRRGDS